MHSTNALNNSNNNAWFLGPTWVRNPNGISISSAVLQGSWSCQTNRPSDRPRYSVCNNRSHLRSTVVRPNDGLWWQLVHPVGWTSRLVHCRMASSLLRTGCYDSLSVKRRVYRNKFIISDQPVAIKLNNKRPWCLVGQICDYLASTCGDTFWLGAVSGLEVRQIMTDFLNSFAVGKFVTVTTKDRAAHQKCRCTTLWSMWHFLTGRDQWPGFLHYRYPVNVAGWLMISVRRIPRPLNMSVDTARPTHPVGYRSCWHSDTIAIEKITLACSDTFQLSGQCPVFYVILYRETDQ